MDLGVGTGGFLNGDCWPRTGEFGAVLELWRRLEDLGGPAVEEPLLSKEGSRL